MLFHDAALRPASPRKNFVRIGSTAGMLSSPRPRRPRISQHPMRLAERRCRRSMETHTLLVGANQLAARAERHRIIQGHAHHGVGALPLAYEVFEKPTLFPRQRPNPIVADIQRNGQMRHSSPRHHTTPGETRGLYHRFSTVLSRNGIRRFLDAISIAPLYCEAVAE